MTTNNKYKIVRYGLCMNDNCTKSKTKEKQLINGREDFVCKECGKPLFECPPPTSWWNKNRRTLLVGLAVIVLLSICFLFVMFTKNDNDTELPAQSVSKVIEESPIKVEPKVEKDAIVSTSEKNDSEHIKKTVTSVDNGLDLGYATYKGRIKNGLPHDENGRMSFKEKHLIDKRDSQKRMADPGDYIIGEYVNGKLVQGVWYNKKNIVKGSIIIGL